MKNVSNIYEGLKNRVRKVIEDRIAKGIMDSVVWAAKKYLKIQFILSVAKIAYRVTTNCVKIYDKLSSVYDIYQIAFYDEDYFDMGYLTGEAAAIVFVWTQFLFWFKIWKTLLAIKTASDETFFSDVFTVIFLSAAVAN